MRTSLKVAGALVALLLCFSAGAWVGQELCERHEISQEDMQ